MAASSHGQQAVAQLRVMFSNADPLYLEAAVSSWPSDWPVDKLVQRVSGKLLDANRGHWPTVLYRDLSRYNAPPHSSPSKQPRRVSFGRSFKGKGRASDVSKNSSSSSSILQVDETESRNVALIALNDMFPSIDLEHLRAVLLETKHSYIYEALAALLNDPSLGPDSSHLLGRNGRTAGGGPKRPRLGEMGRADLIRDPEYIESALNMLCAQFPNLWRTSMKAVMAEHNFDYFTSVSAVMRLEDVRSGSIFTKAWSAVASAFASPSRTSEIPSEFSIQRYLSNLGSTTVLSPTLVYELHLHLSSTRPRPQHQPVLPETPTVDSIECGCCFSEIYVIDAAACASGCLFCTTCLNRAVEETVFGQAPLTLYRPEAKEGDYGAGMGIRCLSIEGCQAAFSDKELARVLPDSTHQALEKKVAREVLQISVLPKIKEGQRRSNTRVVECGFCPYAEVEESSQLRSLFDAVPLHSVILAYPIFLFLYCAWVMGAFFCPEILTLPNGSPTQSHTSSTGDTWTSAYIPLAFKGSLGEISNRIRSIMEVCSIKRKGTVFRCRNIAPASKSPNTTTFASPAHIHSLLPPAPASGKETDFPTRYCGRSSCLLCNKLYYAGHRCNDSVEGLRLAMETAASNAVKRQCPECGLSFIKSDGCNKMTCRCGYIMCFVCRKGIGTEGYAHFCQHPREPGEKCTVCVRCDLFKTEDDGKAAKQAAEMARKEWIKAHPEVEKKKTKEPVAKALMNEDGPEYALYCLESLTERCFTWLLADYEHIGRRRKGI